jgi:sugar O-acyltransferase (sialic acid O-acetyltransferase NeuD family)
VRFEVQDQQGKVIIVGDSEIADIAYEYLTYDSDWEVAGFTVERNYMQRTELFGLPIVPFEELETYYSPREYNAFVALSYLQLNRVRTRLFHEVKKKGFSTVSYVSSRAFVWRNVNIGTNCFVFENNVIQYGVTIGDNVVLWSGNHIGHSTKIGANCFISSHVVISGFCEIGENCFLGVNSFLIPHVKVARDCTIGAGAGVLKDTEEGRVYVGNPARASGKTSYEVFGCQER